MKIRIFFFLLISSLFLSEKSFASLPCTGQNSFTCIYQGTTDYQDGSHCDDWACNGVDACGKASSWNWMNTFPASGGDYTTSVGCCPSSDLDVYNDPVTPVLQSGGTVYISLYKNIGTLTPQTVYQIKANTITSTFSRPNASQASNLQTWLSATSTRGDFTMTDLNTHKTTTYSANLRQHEISVGGNILTITATGLLTDSKGNFVGNISLFTPPTQAQIAAAINAATGSQQQLLQLLR